MVFYGIALHMPFYYPLLVTQSPPSAIKSWQPAAAPTPHPAPNQCTRTSSPL